MSPGSVSAGNLIRGWMEEVGLRTLAFYLWYICQHLRNFANALLEFQMGRQYGECTRSC